ncbi:aromatase/cyclase [Sphaerisporangium perillae]|uniref:aromatase/cyclase n=1 Tax=Sphaerisporangium perillae TaxID=2935860 RepID=UPI00200EE6B1|nr:aromatase/cyclase [Sphaerisporangium perillae]
METTYVTEHSVTIAAPADAVYRLIADVGAWPLHFGPTIHAERAEGDDTEELIRIWATANGEIRSWTSRRELHRDERRVVFRQQTPQPPAASMGGEWVIRPLTGGRTDVVLKHDFSAIGDDPEKVQWIRGAVDRNSGTELAGLKAAAERFEGLGELTLSFADTVLIDGSAKDAYDFVHRCQDWPERLPHVSRISLTEDVPGLQSMEMDTVSPDGSAHTTSSFRVCSPCTRIVYKQVVLPKIMMAHTGRWSFEETDRGVLVTSSHTVVIRPESVPELLGPEATLAEARGRVREALSANSSTTLRCAKSFVESGAALEVCDG